MKLDPFYPIFDNAAWFESLIPLGIKLVQLRMKDQSESVVRDHIRTAKAICNRFECQLVINDYWQLAIEEGCDFIHLGQEDLFDADLAAIRKAGLKLGVSTHDDKELDRALSISPEYIALGPVYPTRLKKMKWAPQGLERVGIWKNRIGKIPLVAIGGLNIERIEGVFAAGCDSAAVVTDITLNGTPEERVEQWIKATQPWR